MDSAVLKARRPVDDPEQLGCAITLSEVQRWRPKDGDVLAVTMPLGTDKLHADLAHDNLLAWLHDKGIHCTLIVLPHGASLAVIDEDAMAEAGWVRA